MTNTKTAALAFTIWAERLKVLPDNHPRVMPETDSAEKFELNRNEVCTVSISYNDRAMFLKAAEFIAQEIERRGSVGRKKKFANDAERYAFHNANRKKKPGSKQ